MSESRETIFLSIRKAQATWNSCIRSALAGFTEIEKERLQEDVVDSIPSFSELNTEKVDRADRMKQNRSRKMRMAGSESMCFGELS